MSVYAGDTMVGTGSVVGKRREERDGCVRHLVDVELTIGNQHGDRCASVSATIAIPAREDVERSRLWW